MVGDKSRVYRVRVLIKWDITHNFGVTSKSFVRWKKKKKKKKKKETNQKKKKKKTQKKPKKQKPKKKKKQKKKQTNKQTKQNHIKLIKKYWNTFFYFLVGITEG